MAGILISLVCSLIWAGVIIGTKVLTADIPAAAFAFIRYALVVLCLLPFYIAHKEYHNVKMADVPALFFLGFSLVFIFNLVFFTALSYTTATSVGFIGAINPMALMSLAAILGYFTPQPYHIVAFFLGFIGTMLLVVKGHMGFSVFIHSTGELYALAAVAFQTIYAMVLRKMNMSYSTLFVTFWTALSGILFLLPFIANKEFLRIVVQLSASQWGIFLGIGLLGSTLAIFLYASALKQLGPSLISMIVFTSMPIFIAVGAHILLGEMISFREIVGGSLIIASLLIGLTPRE